MAQKVPSRSPLLSTRTATECPPEHCRAEPIAERKLPRVGSPKRQVDPASSPYLQRMAKAEQGDDGRFVRSGYSNDERYELVRDVARHARPDAPHELTMVEFNDAAPFVAKKLGKPKPPKAHTIKTSLKKSWPTIVAEALDRSRNVQQTRVANERSEPGLHLDERYIHYSLRRIAREIGEDFGDDQYDAARVNLIAARERHPGNELPLILATSGQILWLADGDWAKARALAGLPPRARRGGNKPALAMENLVEHYYETKGSKPTYKQLRAYGHDELEIGVPALAKLKWADWLERTRVRRDERGLAFEDTGPRDGERLNPDEIAALLDGARSAASRSRTRRTAQARPGHPRRSTGWREYWKTISPFSSRACTTRSNENDERCSFWLFARCASS